MSERTCSVDGCTQAHRARGLCSTHYNQQRYTTNQRHPKTAIPCDWCGKPAVKDQGRSDRYAKLFCSLSCRDTARQSRKLPVLYAGPAFRPRPESSVLGPRLFVAGRCRHCDTPFIDRQADARYCSELCCRRYWRKVYKDDVPQSTWSYVLERDGWRCQICRRGIPALVSVPHPKAATVDHIVPRSQGGNHDPANLRAAHFECNTRRNNRGGNEQLALIG